MVSRKKLPIGIENFEDIYMERFYYVDKTSLIKDLLENWGEVSLFTRPRRFGKSLMISMIKSFFEYGSNQALFDELEISKEREICAEYMGKFPVISISLKDVNELDYESAKASVRYIIGSEALRFQFLQDSDQLTEAEKRQYAALININLQGDFTMADTMLLDSIRLLSNLLYKHYNQKTIILIDEYDVPLDKAHQFGYYEQMVVLIRNIFSKALKTNNSLYFAVLTGCLRISKESIFTGLNNLQIFSIADADFAEYFGFTDAEVKAMLSYYDMDCLYDTVRQWYDGYQFGNANIYCPWDVISYMKDHLRDLTVPPKMYWLNTSENAIVRDLIRRADAGMKMEIEELIAGGAIVKSVNMELTYKDLDEPEEGKPDTHKENLWSILYITGYLTMAEQSLDGRNYKLIIPNKEIHNIFIKQVKAWMQQTIVEGNTVRLNQFCKAVKDGDLEKFENMFNDYLDDTISIRDTSVPKYMKENFYHGLLLGILRGQGTWLVKSNLESGIGYSDIVVEIRREKIGCIFEMKYAEHGRLDAACAEALEQIKHNDYTAILRQDGIQTIHTYGVACFKKTCKVVAGEND